MNRQYKNRIWPGFLVLGLLFLVLFAASCKKDDPVTPTNTNDAPNAPVINTTAGAPEDQATDVALAVALHWTCTDPDGDPLTYTVRFGPAGALAVVAQDQAGTSYTPASLAHDTAYQWQVTAKDDGGKTTASPTWDFTTVAAGVETVTWPALPTGPTSGDIGQDLSYTTSGGGSSEGHALEYRFDWGDGSFSDWGNGTAVSHSWTTSGTFYVRAQARCTVHTSAESAWSSSLGVAIEVDEIVYAPQTPAGEVSVAMGASHGYTTGNGISSQGHEVEYRFDWADGTMSDWADLILVQHAWDTAGTYEVRAQARCADHPDIESPWSYVSLSVTVQAPETVSTPNSPAGPATGEIQETLQFDLSGAESSWGHTLEYKVDWSGGNFDDWFVGTTRYHTWSSPGTYEIIVQARCQDHPSVESAWSTAATVVITEPAETVSSPNIYDPPTVGGVGEDLQFQVLNGGSNLFHPVEYRLDWGDGDFSMWGPSPYYRTHAWTAAGIFEVRAQTRCADHPDVVSDWSDFVPIEILDTEFISTPILNPSGERTYDLGDWEFFTSYGTVSNMGHSVEFQMDFGDETMSGWTPNPASVHFEEVGDFEIKLRARCQEHTDVVSEWSDPFLAHVIDPNN